LNRIIRNVIRHLKSDRKIFVVKLSLDVLWIWPQILLKIR